MSVSTSTISVPQSTARLTRSIPRTTVVAGVAAAAITTAAAAVAHAAGVSFAVNGEMIPLAGFAQMTALGAIIGGILLAILNRRSANPQRRFLQTTMVLTALSCVPSVALPDDAASKVTLVALHVLAAAIVVPQLVRHAHN
jgi:hypothetical protein